MVIAPFVEESTANNVRVHLNCNTLNLKQTTTVTFRTCVRKQLSATERDVNLVSEDDAYIHHDSLKKCPRRYRVIILQKLEGIKRFTHSNFNFIMHLEV